MLQEWVQGDHFAFDKNTNYWKTGKPYLDGLTVRIFRGEQPAMSELEGGTVDAMRMTSVDDVVRLEEGRRSTRSWSTRTPGPSTSWVQRPQAALRQQGGAPGAQLRIQSPVLRADDLSGHGDAARRCRGAPARQPTRPTRPTLRVRPRQGQELAGSGRTSRAWSWRSCSRAARTWSRA